MLETEKITWWRRVKKIFEIDKKEKKNENAYLWPARVSQTTSYFFLTRAKAFKNDEGQGTLNRWYSHVRAWSLAKRKIKNE